MPPYLPSAARHLCAPRTAVCRQHDSIQLLPRVKIQNAAFDATRAMMTACGGALKPWGGCEASGMCGRGGCSGAKRRENDHAAVSFSALTSTLLGRRAGYHPCQGQQIPPLAPPAVVRVVIRVSWCCRSSLGTTTTRGATQLSHANHECGAM